MWISGCFLWYVCHWLMDPFKNLTWSCPVEVSSHLNFWWWHTGYATWSFTQLLLLMFLLFVILDADEYYWNKLKRCFVVLLLLITNCCAIHESQVLFLALLCHFLQEKKVNILFLRENSNFFSTSLKRNSD